MKSFGIFFVQKILPTLALSGITQNTIKQFSISAITFLL